MTAQEIIQSARDGRPIPAVALLDEEIRAAIQEDARRRGQIAMLPPIEDVRRDIARAGSPVA